MASYPLLSKQQETNRIILEELQQKKQLLQKGVSPVVGGISGQQVNQFLVLPLDVGQSTGTVSASPRSSFNPNSSTTLGFFVPQDSLYGNSFIPVLPRLDPLPANHATK